MNEPTESEAGVMAKIIFLSVLDPVTIATLLAVVVAVVILVVFAILRLTKRKDE